MIRPNRGAVRPKRPSNFCYHCNQNFGTKEELKLHVSNISRRSNQRAPDYPTETGELPRVKSQNGMGYSNNQHNRRRQSLKLICDHCDCVFQSMAALQAHTASLMQQKHKEDPSPDHHNDNTGQNYQQQNSSTSTVGTVKVECDFFELNEDEFNQIKNSSNPQFASFTLDGKECYHCGEEFPNNSAMHQHPSVCTRMKNATNLGKVVKIDGTVEEINNVIIPPTPIGPARTFKNSRPSTSNGNNFRPKKQVEMHRVLTPEPSDNLIIDQEDDDINVDELNQANNVGQDSPDSINNEQIQYDHLQRQPLHETRPVQNHHYNVSQTNAGIKCNLCDKMVKDRSALRIHQYECKRNYQLPVRKAGQSASVIQPGNQCFHCDRLFPSIEDLRAHVAELSKMNLAEY